MSNFFLSRFRRGCHLLRLQRSTIGHSVKPIPHHLSWLNRGRLANENEKSGLKAILGVVRIVEHPLADAQDHPTVPAHQFLESGFVFVADEKAQEMPVADVVNVAGRRRRIGGLDALARENCRHVHCLGLGAAILCVYWTRRA
jgi:hypothetical protein